ncbi:hypothetical protein RhiJN_05808 [Ceratobasidium sp. AG-Ba]|nr:hypothetical protein RhiJN_05808 [Ceratobasidium sp. AG-Ba]QRW06737.1 hypothetical protein RhiLY_05736 [Ceratobasidium sp. AG-Ba]
MSHSTANLDAAASSLPIYTSSSTRNPFYKRWNRANELVTASLVSSREILNRGKMWSSATREGMLVMDAIGDEFQDTWQSGACLAEQWYRTQIQRAKQHGSTTRFRTIQHRSTLDAPFFHEFLIVILLDGSLYRVERTGVGSNLDAIRPSGCRARDLIEWFPADQYEAFARDKPSRLIAEVEFPCEFDILDVLAACYSMQTNGAGTYGYTLQCYNCYFFCCAILSVLARRVANWESVITPDRWSYIFDQSFDQLFELSVMPLKPKAREYFALRVCSLLDPQSPRPAQFLLEWLRSLLSKHNIFKEHLGRAIWWSNYGPLVFKGLTRLFSEISVEGSSLGAISIPEPSLMSRKAALIACQHDKISLCARTLGSVLTDGWDTESSSKESIASMHSRAVATATLRDMRVISKHLKVFSKRRKYVSIGTRVLASVNSLRSSLYTGIHVAMGHHEAFQGIEGLSRLKFGSKVAAASFRMGSTDMLADKLICPRMPLGEYPSFPFPTKHKDLSEDLLSSLEQTGIATPENTAEACRLMMTDQDVAWREWNESIARMLDRTFSANLKEELKVSGSKIKLVTPDQGEPFLNQEVDVFTFQEHISKHIQTDAEEAILKAWLSLPSGFGANQPPVTPT